MLISRRLSVKVVDITIRPILVRISYDFFCTKGAIVPFGNNSRNYSVFIYHKINEKVIYPEDGLTGLCRRSNPRSNLQGCISW